LQLVVVFVVVVVVALTDIECKLRNNRE